MKFYNLTDYFIEEDEYICGNRYINFSDGENTVFCKTDYIPEYSMRQINTFITHNSDHHITKEVYKLGPAVKNWFCQNKDYEIDKLVSIPIGIENYEPIFNYQSKFGKYSTLPQNGPFKKEYISELSLVPYNHDKLVYLNINPTTYPSERNQVINRFKNKPWVTYKSNLDWKEYYDDISRHKFIISPRGNGVDCHRTWESLYLRTIPIVIKSLHMNEFADLPILLVDSWDQINENFLLTEYDKIVKKTLSINKLKLSYWAERILNE